MSASTSQEREVPPATLRHPLQTGDTALDYCQLLVASGLAADWGIAAAERWNPLAGPWAAFLSLPILAIAYSAWRARASDVSFEPLGLQVSGGRWDGLFLPYGEIDVAETRVRVERDDDAGTALVVASRSGERTSLASASDKREIASLETLAALVRVRATSATSAAGDAQVHRPLEIEIARCAGCGAPLRPGPAARVRCARCGSEQVLPDWLVARAAQPEHAARVQRLVRKSLRQPTAGLVNQLLLALMLAATFLVPLVGYWLWAQRGVALLVASAAGTAVALVRRVAVDRHAARVTSAMAAVAPVTPEEGSSCRYCGAPLPSSHDAIVTCAYCESANVLGFAGCRTPSDLVKDHATVRAFLAARSWARWSADARLAAWVALGAYGAQLFWRT